MENKDEKVYTNLDLIGLSEKDFCSQITNDFIDDSFIGHLEWALLLAQSKMKQSHYSSATNEIKMSTFDKSYLISGAGEEVRRDLYFFTPYTDLQATPQMFPLLNMKNMLITDTVQFHKVRELSNIDKRGLYVNKKYAFQNVYSYYNKKTESFYAQEQGFAVSDTFFKLHDLPQDQIIGNLNSLISPVILKKGYVPSVGIEFYDRDTIRSIFNQIAMSYQVALTMFYEWSLYIKDINSIGIIIPISPSILKEIYTTSLMKFENRKAMLHFVREHYRRLPNQSKEDYSVFVSKYLRGEFKFNYNGFLAEIIPPKYDINRVKTKKKFIDPNC